MQQPQQYQHGDQSSHKFNSSSSGKTNKNEINSFSGQFCNRRTTTKYLSNNTANNSYNIGNNAPLLPVVYNGDTNNSNEYSSYNKFSLNKGGCYNGSGGKYSQYAFGQIPNRIFIGGVPPFTTEIELRGIFEQYGYVRDVRLIIDKASNLKGYGFITYENNDIVKKILLERDHVIFRGKRLNISSAFRKPKTNLLFEPQNYLYSNNGAGVNRSGVAVNGSISDSTHNGDENKDKHEYTNEIGVTEALDNSKTEYSGFYPNMYGGYYSFPAPMYYSPQFYNDYAHYLQFLSPQSFSLPDAGNKDGNVITPNNIVPSSALAFTNGMVPSPFTTNMESHSHDNTSYPIMPMDVYKNFVMSSPVTQSQMYGYWYANSFLPSPLVTNNNHANSQNSCNNISSLQQSTLLSPNVSFDEKVLSANNIDSFGGSRENRTSINVTLPIPEIKKMQEDNEQNLNDLKLN